MGIAGVWYMRTGDRIQISAERGIERDRGQVLQREETLKKEVGDKIEGTS